MAKIRNSNLTLEDTLRQVVVSVVNNELKENSTNTGALDVKKQSVVAEVVSVTTTTSLDTAPRGETIVIKVQTLDAGQVYDIAYTWEGFVRIPVVGSLVYLDFVDSTNRPDILTYSDLDAISLLGTEYGGLVIIEKLTEKLNSLVDEVNALKDKFNQHIHTTTATVGTGPVGVIAPVTSQAVSASSFDKIDYENIHVTHGPNTENL